MRWKTLTADEEKAQVEFVKKIFKMRNEGKTLEQIGKEVSRTREFVRQVLSGISYGHIKKKYNLEVDELSAMLAPYHLTRQDVLNMVESVNNGASVGDLAEEYDKSESTVRNFFSGTRSKQILKAMNLKYDEIYAKAKRNAKLFRDEDLIAIFKFYEEGLFQEDIAREFGVPQTLISQVLRGDRYTEEIAALGLKTFTSEFSEEEVLEIFKLYNEGVPASVIADKFKRTAGSVTKVLNKEGKVYQRIFEKHDLEKRFRPFAEHKRVLNEEQILKAFELRNKKNRSIHSIAGMFGVSNTVMHKLFKGETYKEIIEKHKLKDTYVRGKREATVAAIPQLKRRMLSETQIVEIFKLRNEQNLSIAKIAKICSIGMNTVDYILQGKRYKEVIAKYKLIDKKRVK